MIEGKLLIDGEWVGAEERFPVFDKYTNEVIAQVAVADAAQVEAAVQAASQAMAHERIEPHRRYQILMQSAQLLGDRKREVVDIMVAETGFTVTDAENDFDRCLQTLTISAEEAKRIAGKVIPLEGAPGQGGRIGLTVLTPVGVVCAITPFNSPLNTVAHKIAPALAAGNSVVLKPASYTPLCSLHLCEVLQEAGLPPGWINLVNGEGSSVGNLLLQNQDIRYYTFTGSTGVGRAIQAGAGLRRTQLELGNISATIVCADADFNIAIPKCVATAFRKAGQVCTSLQRLYVQEDVLDDFMAQLVEATKAMVTGNPRDPDVSVGPMIDVKEAERAESWVKQAIEQGAKLVIGGGRDGALLESTILTEVTTDMRVVADELFAPVLTVIPFDNLDTAIDALNDTPFGLSAGIFTADITSGMKAAERVEVGCFHINQTSSSRIDLMPYGGIKDSGFGREGPKYAIRDMTEEKLITFTPV